MLKLTKTNIVRLFDLFEEKYGDVKLSELSHQISSDPDLEGLFLANVSPLAPKAKLLTKQDMNTGKGMKSLE